MRAVLQRVSRAEVRVDGQILGKIARGFVVLLGVAQDDSEADAAKLADRILGIRVFADSAGKMNCALDAVDGELLVVSQFTLLADTDSGRRPSFHPRRCPRRSAPPLRALPRARAQKRR